MAVSLDTSASNVRTFSVSTDPLTVGSRWKKWKRAFEYFVVGRGVTNAAQKKALLLNMAGKEAQDIFEVLPAGEGANEYARAMAALDTHFTPKTNIPYERSVFCRTELTSGETITNYITRLRQLAITCEYDDVDNVIRDQVIEKCKSSHLRRRLLERGSELTLAHVISISQTEEAVSMQSADIHSSGAAVNNVRNGRNNPHKKDTHYT
ncbi:hypothetical protein EB796_011565 [Bugula neritina]|uniref:Retrotransposon gag domain-containing protein n=1 Tax=Bugula neritina TaxID=10212 RepID=A0A7J7JW95_BUGNE|nr:hypothetical protein EB796_011565 [Bugula neritina]